MVSAAMVKNLIGVALVFLIVEETTQYAHYAQECRVYRLKTSTAAFQTPVIPVQNMLTISFYNQHEDDVIKNIHIILKGSERTENVHINPDGEVALSTFKRNNFTLGATYPANSWISLVILLQDDHVILYKMDERENCILCKNGSLGSNVTAKVTTNRQLLHVTLNCPAGCLMHDENSPLIGRHMPIGFGVRIYLSHVEGATDAKLVLKFKDRNEKSSSISADITQLESSFWHKIEINHDGQSKIVVTLNENDVIGEIQMAREDAHFVIQRAASVLWSLHCHHETAQKGWGLNQNITKIVTPDKGAGVGEVLAWVLAGMALFMVMIMALLLCTRMGPKTDTLDYGASVGVVTSFGKQVSFRNVEREAEEDTEPDSPTIISTTIHHKVPEEEDELKNTTKML